MSEDWTAPVTPAEWETTIRVAAASHHQAARDNAVAVAGARSRLSWTDDAGSLVSRSTLAELARESGFSNDQMQPGTKSLRDWGYMREVAPRGSNTPATYQLIVPSHDVWRRTWANPPGLRAPVEHSLTPGQAEVMDLVGRFISGESPLGSDRHWEDHVLVIHGYAGTGKTTTVVRAVREHVEDLARVLFVAPSNKAAAVLRQEGVTARTIHSAFYRVTGEANETGEPIFVENPINDGQAYTLVVVDKASMVDKDVARWVESQSTRLIMIGDPMQLQPVKGIAHWTAPGQEPDYTLTEVVRTRDSVLEEAFQMVRDGTALSDVDSLRLDRGCTVDPTRFDVVVTYTNQERVIVNQMFRGGGSPVPGDRIMLLANSSRPSRDFLGPDDYYNGQVLHLSSVIRSSHPSGGVVLHHEVEYIDENGMPRRLLILDRWLHAHPSSDNPEAASPARRRIGYRDALPATYAYAITAHKAQGSGWDDVLIVLPGNRSQLRGEEANRWATPPSRAPRNARRSRASIN